MKRRRQVLDCVDCLAIQPDEVEVDLRLCEWARWSRGGRRRYASIGSVESAYVSPQHWHRPEPSVPIIVRNVLVVERSVNDLPGAERCIICMWYVGRASHRQICNKLRMSAALFIGRLRYSRLMVRNLLRFHEGASSLASQQFAPRRGTPVQPDAAARVDDRLEKAAAA